MPCSRICTCAYPNAQGHTCSHTPPAYGHTHTRIHRITQSTTTPLYTHRCRFIMFITVVPVRLCYLPAVVQNGHTNVLGNTHPHPHHTHTCTACSHTHSHTHTSVPLAPEDHRDSCGREDLGRGSIPQVQVHNSTSPSPPFPYSSTLLQSDCKISNLSSKKYNRL